MKTRRQFLAQSVMLTAGALLSSWDAAALDATAYPTQPNITFPTNPRDRLAVASYPFRDFILPAEYVSASASVPRQEWSSPNSPRT